MGEKFQKHLGKHKCCIEETFVTQTVLKPGNLRTGVGSRLRSEFNLIKLHRRNNERREEVVAPPPPASLAICIPSLRTMSRSSRRRGDFTLFHLRRCGRGKFIKFHLRHLRFWCLGRGRAAAGSRHGGDIITYGIKPGLTQQTVDHHLAPRAGTTWVIGI